MLKLSVLAALAAASLFALALPALAANKSKPAAAWAPQTLSGKIMMVDPAARLVVVQDSSGTPFDLMVTPRTRIEQGSRQLTLKDLAGDTNQGASVRFIPERKGDVARSIDMQG